MSAVAEPREQPLIRELAQLARYRDLLIEWNEKFNLTAIKTPAEIDRWLIGDALRMLPVVGRYLPDATPRLIDIGTGAGFPGLVVKIARPDVSVTLVDATRKKVDFLRAVIEDLELGNVEVVHGRAEDLGHRLEHRGRYDVATARAVAATPALLELCMPLVRVGGVGIFPKSLDIAAELAEAESVAPSLHCRLACDEIVKSSGETRVTRLLVFAKMDLTPKRFPRRPGLPAREPLGRMNTS